MEFSERLRKIRLEKGLSKSDLAAKIGVHYSQIGRYEEKGAFPSADVMAKIANVLEVSTDFLLNGTTDELAASTLSDKVLLNQFKAIEQMGEQDKNTIKTLIDAFVIKNKLKVLAL